MKGIFSTSVLEELERAHCGNAPLVDYFDMICGTSTGGIIAFGLALGKKAAELTHFYEEYGPSIFPDRSWRRKVWSLVWNGWIYDHDPLRTALKQTFGDAIIGDSQSLLCVPSYCLTKGDAWIWKFDHKEGALNRDNRTKIVDAALATTAAPVFLPKVTIESQFRYQFVDGGVYANNPALVALTEALHYFVGDNKEFQHLSILSVSSLNESAAEAQDLPKRDRLWFTRLAPAFMTGQGSSINFMVKTLCASLEPKLTYVRIPSDTIGLQQQPEIRLDAASDKSITLMKAKGHDQGLLWAKDPKVKAFFEHKKLYQTQASQSHG